MKRWLIALLFISVPSYAILGDLNRDGRVDFADFFIFADNFGKEGPPEPVDTLSVIQHNKILFVSDLDGDNDIYIMGTDGTEVTQLIDTPASETAPSWSPDGTKILFASDFDGDSDIYIANADGTNLNQLTNNIASDTDPIWSPDGTKIVFVSDLSGDEGIYVMNGDGTNLIQLTGGVGTISGLSW